MKCKPDFFLLLDSTFFPPPSLHRHLSEGERSPASLLTPAEPSPAVIRTPTNIKQVEEMAITTWPWCAEWHTSHRIFKRHYIVVVSVSKLCPTLRDPMDCASPGSSIDGISEARILEQVAISFSRGSSWPRNQTRISCIGRWVLYHWAPGKPGYYMKDFAHPGYWY